MLEGFINEANIVLVVVLLVAGFALLIKGADCFVDGASSIARQLCIPGIIIGLTVVAMGTSLPETAVSVTAALSHNNELAVSNAVGSNIFNTMVVIGVCAVMTPVAVQKQTVRRDFPFSAVSFLLLLFLGYIGLADARGMILGRLDGMVLLVLFAVYIIMLVRQAMKARRAGNIVSAVEEEEAYALLPTWKSLLFIIAGGAAIAFGGDLTVNAASRIATELGMSQTLVGLTIVSIGTSLPELVTSIVAARKGEVDMALGNAIGSNIFNFLMVLGIAAALCPINFIAENIIDIVILLALTLLVWIFAVTGRRIGRKEGCIMLLLYAAYAIYIIVR